MSREALVIALEELGSDGTSRAGGKTASPGEMIRGLGEEGTRLPGAFATAARAYRRSREENGLEKRAREEIGRLKEAGVPEVGRAIRDAFLEGAMPEPAADVALRAPVLRRVAPNGGAPLPAGGAAPSELPQGHGLLPVQGAAQGGGSGATAGEGGGA